jgi:predicted type IV restriction endonuclease
MQLVNLFGGKKGRKRLRPFFLRLPTTGHLILRRSSAQPRSFEPLNFRSPVRKFKQFGRQSSKDRPMTAPPIVHEMVERFDRNRQSYESAQYNEAQLRQEFLDPLFEALGWDMDNEQGHAEAYKDVIHEDAIKVGGATKAPDYCFRIGGRRIFFLEAKKPAVNVRDDMSSAFQLRRYAWSAKLPLSVLSSFAETAVYDCRLKPDKDDKPSVGRVLFLAHGQLEEKWDELSGIFSREAVLKGSFDKFAESTKAKRGTSQVDAAFLAEIESWRDQLARHLTLRNAIDQQELNFAVQRIIDRIIFLRMCEDRGIETYGQLLSLLGGENSYRRLCEIFDRADERYNSGLFHFQPERGRAEQPDELTPRLIVDDRPLKNILRGLYYPESPYEFSVLPAEILGQVYEQFLGKVILKTARRASVEDKPEVKKAGGVYYTPAYIVDYIVKNTVGELVKDSTPKQVAKLRVVDPACGSGSFLVAAFQFLIDWHRDWYVGDGVKKHTKEVYQGPGGQWHLATAEKRRILLNTIYGVDIDSQAVEVTKLSLLLKVLENENRDSLDRQLRMHHQRALPDLGNNIKCGNSLIGPDFYNGQQLSLLDDEEQMRVNVFDWKVEFPSVLKGKDCGFDAVIGNPPYVRMEGFKSIKDYLRERYSSHQERADLYAYFLERGTTLLRPSGMLGMIVSNKFIRAKYGAPLRRMLSRSSRIRAIADFAGARVFVGATVRTVVLIACKQPCRDVAAIYLPVPDRETIDAFLTKRLSILEYAAKVAVSMASGAVEGDDWRIGSADSIRIIDRIRRDSVPMAEFVRATAAFGLKTGLNEAFVVDRASRDRMVRRDAKSKQILLPILFGRDVRRYHTYGPDRFVIYLNGQELNQFPAARDHLSVFRPKLANRAGSQKWFELQQPAAAVRDRAMRPKIVYPIIAPECRFCLETDRRLINDKLFLIDSDDVGLLAILNSRLANLYFSAVCAALEGSTGRYLEFRAQYVDKFPVPKHFPGFRQKNILEKLGRTMLDLHKRQILTRTADERTRIKRLIAATDRQIDNLVYELYGLTEAEIALVEEATEK